MLLEPLQEERAAAFGTSAHVKSVEPEMGESWGLLSILNIALRHYRIILWRLSQVSYLSLGFID
jgi:hypothetical protein